MPIPVQVSADRALARQERYEGRLDASALMRLQEYEPQDVEARIGIRRDVAGQGWVEGEASARLTLECRLCTATFEQPLAVRFALAIARDEEHESRLMDRAEPLLINDDRLPLQAIVEDELLLGLPMMPRCPACENTRSPPGDEASSPSTRRPLAALKDLNLKGGSSTRGK